MDTRYQLGFVVHAGSLTAAVERFETHGTWESAINAAASALTSAANDARNFVRSRNKQRPAAAVSGAQAHLAVGS